MPAETTPTGARDGDPSARLGSWISARTKMAALQAASTKWTARNASASSSRVDGAGADVSRRSFYLGPRAEEAAAAGPVAEAAAPPPPRG